MPDRNRILFTSVCSLAWTTFLAYMKQLDQDKKQLEEAAQAAKLARLHVPTEA